MIVCRDERCRHCNNCGHKAEYHRREPWGIGVCLMTYGETSCACGNHKEREQ